MTSILKCAAAGAAAMLLAIAPAAAADDQFRAVPAIGRRKAIGQVMDERIEHFALGLNRIGTRDQGARDGP